MVKDKKSISNKAKFLTISPWIAGAIIGFLAASLQTFASMTKPPAYGLCIACHSRDLINSIVNGISGANLFIAPIIENPIFIPPLTIIGIMLGSFVASSVAKEFSITKVKEYSSLLKMFILGFLIMNFALILGACPIRAALRTAHGDIIALVGLVFIGVGAIVATMVLERRVEV